MKRTLLYAALFVVFTVGLVALQQSEADAGQPSVELLSTYGDSLPVTAPEADERKRCSFSSDCSHGKCKKNKCGGCSFSSDCKGWGKCKGGWCGGCSFSSDCKGFGKCSRGRCTKSPY